jgi:hypothetical protein
MTTNLPLIRASELTQYSFCHRAWWLATVKQVRPANQDTLTQGTAAHQRHAHQVRVALRWRWVGLILSGLGSVLLLLALIYNF